MKKKKTRRTRKPKTNRVKRTRAGASWTESSFFSFLRSNLRRTSMKWPPIVKEALLRVRAEYKGTRKNQKWIYKCECCNEWKNRKEVSVDHVEPCGSLNSFADLVPFTMRLFCELDGLWVLCRYCHKLKGAVDAFIKKTEKIAGSSKKDKGGEGKNKGR